MLHEPSAGDPTSLISFPFPASLSQAKSRALLLAYHTEEQTVGDARVVLLFIKPSHKIVEHRLQPLHLGLVQLDRKTRRADHVTRISLQKLGSMGIEMRQRHLGADISPDIEPPGLSRRPHRPLASVPLAAAWLDVLEELRVEQSADVI